MESVYQKIMRSKIQVEPKIQVEHRIFEVNSVEEAFLFRAVRSEIYNIMYPLRTGIILRIYKEHDE